MVVLCLGHRPNKLGRPVASFRFGVGHIAIGLGLAAEFLCNLLVMMTNLLPPVILVDLAGFSGARAGPRRPLSSCEPTFPGPYHEVLPDAGCKFFLKKKRKKRKEPAVKPASESEF